MLTLQFISSQELRNLGINRITKLLNFVKENNIIVVEGGLSPKEEVDLISLTMDRINTKFRGIEIATLNPNQKGMDSLEKLRVQLGCLILGRKQGGMTVVGPSNIIKEIKKDPNKIQLFTSNGKRRKNAPPVR